MGKLFKKILIATSVIYISLFALNPAIFADEQADKLAQQAQLQQQLLDIQNQIAQFQQQLAQTQAEKNTLANKIKALKKQQDVLNLQIQQTNLQVTALGGQIVETKQSISQNIEHTAELKKKMAEIIRRINQNDAYPFLYTVVSKQQLSDVFNAYYDYQKISESLSGVVAEIKKTNIQLGAKQEELAVQQEEAENLLSIKVLQQAQLDGTVGQQNALLQETKGREADYQITLNDTKRRAAEIQGRIYQLLGISSQITFGEALKIAQWAEQTTGIRPAFLLAILTQESNLGKNVGTCNRPGDPPSKSYKVVMKPDRDIQPFLQITSELGIDPEVTPVSCPLRDKNGNQQGWGGAMGPAQFIPSTWMGYKDKVTAITGKAANPWDIRDAFLASAIKLRAGGADGTYQGEWNAAMRYFSGGTNVKYRFYGDSVMATAAKYQLDIGDLNK
jgi:membrane-bound lytic murein transglycosylase B